MGCSSSSPSERKRLNASGVAVARSNGEKSKTKANIDKRVECSAETLQASFGGVAVRYAYFSQKGYYPNEVHKPNQDSYVITTNFAERNNDAFFGVFDGHGRDGHHCAHFVRDNLPPLLSKAVTRERRQEEPNLPGELNLVTELSKEATHDAILKSHVECNKRMHDSQDLDDSLSGTTSISAYLHGNRNKITVSNVGDSRAVIGRSANTEKEKDGLGTSTTTIQGSSPLKAFALSRDQTPYRRDERIRCRNAGARILSLDQIEGLEPVNEDDELEVDDSELALVLGEEIDEGGDPPRVWSPNGDYPGTAFTRSIGDAIAEGLGVIAEPEILVRELTTDDKIIVLASDGVFEFLTNQSVIDICAKFNDPLEACRAVVAESYELWLQYELRTDDITMICIFIDNVDTALSMSRAGSIPNLMSQSTTTVESNLSEAAEDDELISHSRPVRKNISLQKSRALVKMKSKYSSSLRNSSGASEDDFDVQQLYLEKTDDEKERISEAIKASVMFQNVTDNERELIYGCMEPIQVKKGQWIIKQGTLGDRFFIIDDGIFEVRIVPEGKEDVSNDGGDVVHVYTGARGRSHPCFGELALLYSTPRAASVIAQTDGHLWGLHRSAFLKVVGDKVVRKGAETVLKKIDAFKSFSEDEISELTSYLCEAKYLSGDIIIKGGEFGDCVFIILPGGSCECVRAANDGSTLTTILGCDDYFGEEVLKQGETKYSSTVTATSKVSCWLLQKADVSSAIGGLRKSTTSAESA